MTQLIGEGLIVGVQGLVAIGLVLFIQSLWRDVVLLFSGKDCE